MSASAEEHAIRLLERSGDEAVWAAYEALPALEREEVVTALKTRVDALVRSRPPLALPASEVLMNAVRELPGLVALALRGRGAALHYNGRSAEAAEVFRRALALYTQAGEELEAARVWRSLVDVLHAAGRIDEALECAEGAGSVFRRLGERRLLAQLEVNLGNLEVHREEYPRARAHYSAALELFRDVDDVLGAAVAEFDLALVEMNANRCRIAARRWAGARETFRAAGFDAHVADCDYSLAYLEFRLGHYADAMEGLGRARELYQREGKPAGVPLCDLDLAEIHLRLDARRDALTLAARAREGFRRLEMPAEEAKAELIMGLAESASGDSRAAATHFAAAARLHREVADETARAVAEIYRAVAESGRAPSMELVEALRSARAEVLQRGMRLPADLATVGLASALEGLGRPEEALGELRPLLERSGSPDELDGLLRVEALAVAASVHGGRGESAAMVRALEEAARAIDELYAEIPTEDVRIAFFRTRAPIFEALAWTLSDGKEGGDLSRALAWLERGRGRSLARPWPIVVEDARRYEELRAELDWLLARKLDLELGLGDGGHELRHVAAPVAEIQRVQRTLAALVKPQRTPVASAEHGGATLLRSAIRAGELSLSFLVTERGGRLFLVEDGDVSVHDLAIDSSSLQALRDRVVLHMEKAALGSRHVEQHAAQLGRASERLLDELGERLLAPVAERIVGREVVLVPQGALHDVPLHALRIGGRWLCELCEPGYAFSLEQLAALRRAAPPVDSAQGILATVADDALLEHAAAEIEALERAYGNLVERAAPEHVHRLLTCGEGPGAILHVASHGIFQQQDPSFSAIRLGDRFLLAHDLMGKQLSTALVFLSGCETGRRLRVGGEELFGLTRAFFSAGVRTVVANLWPVSDADAARFAEPFYSALAAGVPVRRAAVMAQRAVLADQPLAARWAAFALFGDPDLRLPAFASKTS